MVVEPRSEVARGKTREKSVLLAHPTHRNARARLVASIAPSGVRSRARGMARHGLDDLCERLLLRYGVVLVDPASTVLESSVLLMCVERAWLLHVYYIALADPVSLTVLCMYNCIYKRHRS